MYVSISPLKRTLMSGIFTIIEKNNIIKASLEKIKFNLVVFILENVFKKQLHLNQLFVNLILSFIIVNSISYTYDWSLTTDVSRINASKVCGKLGVEHIICSADSEIIGFNLDNVLSKINCIDKLYLR